MNEKLMESFSRIKEDINQINEKLNLLMPETKLKNKYSNISMNIAITGHKGLIGSFLKKRLEEEGHKIVLAIDNREGLSVDLLENHQGFEEKIDLFVHLADFCKINRTVLYPALGHNNAINSYTVLEFCRRNKIPKIIYFSSSRILSAEKNPYTAGKIYGEELCKAYSQCYGIDYSILRPSTVYGPFNDISHRLVDVFIRNALQNKPLEIYGDPKIKTLDFTYIDDFVDAVMIILKKGKWNEDYNISGGGEYLVYDLAKKIIEISRSKSKIIIKEEEVAQPQRVSIDISKMREIGYSPKIGIDEGIKKTIDFYKKQSHF